MGSLVCQLGRQAGARVVAIAGSQDKCEWLEKDLGVEKALNYKSSTFKKDLRSLGYIDAYFDNVGGWDNAAPPVVALLLTSHRRNIGLGSHPPSEECQDRTLRRYLCIQLVLLQNPHDVISHFPSR